MYSSSRISIIGNVGHAPDARVTADGLSWVRVSVATHEKWKDRDGQPQSRTEWHTVVFWGRLAEIAAKHLEKGSHVSIEGTLRSRQYADKDGVGRRVWEIRADRLGLLDPLDKLNDSDSDAVTGSDALAPVVEAEAPF